MPVEIEGKTFDLDASVLDGILDAMEGTAGDGIERGFPRCPAAKSTDCRGERPLGNSAGPSAAT